ncbi:unnamed protein product [Eruca vesicaria subsp. sativa]|uniref:BHLH domain-containing protein n=1 Tax=Eruca vesicaria subsp. sativa TaxID=29727 RepID=A0ABC8ILW8_ERUVS|nr:unnamed protein product [Eruca vesicaria subsp. sativa]
MPLDNRQQKWLPLGLNPPQEIATGSSCPGNPLSKVYAAEHQFRYLQTPPFQALLSSYGKQDSCLNGWSNCDAAPERVLKSSQKRFLVFDQSENQTRLLQCGFPLSVPSSVAADPGKILNFLNLEKGLTKDHAVPEKTLLHEDHVNGGEESEMHEDTEEINALLYSDDDEDNDDCESDDDDEVMSTGHSPFTVEQQQACNNKTEEELVGTESCGDDGPRLKRQKVLDHSYIDLSPSSFVGTTNLKGLLSDEKLQESNISSSNQDMGSGLSDEESRKDKIHTALRILESVVPGAKGKEALLLLDEAIDYLKLLKRNLTSPKGLNNHW